MASSRVLILSCEHAGNEIPPEYKKLFAGSERLLNSHRGWDPGAGELARFLQKNLKVKLITSRYSRLLVDLNRTIPSHDLFSVKTRGLSEKEQARILSKYREPYWDKLRKAVADEIAAGNRVLHISVHSFTPKLRNEVRKTDIGLLFNPERKPELAFCQAWRKQFQRDSDWTVDLNKPYAGNRTGPIPELQKKHGTKYLGFELEINHKILKKEKQANEMQKLIFDTLESILSWA